MGRLNIFHTYIAILGVLLLSLPAYAQTASVRKDTLSLTVYFRQSQSGIDLSFRGNGKNISEFIRKINAMNADSGTLIQSINISTSASPEGTYEFNRSLSMARARSISDYLLSNTTLAPSQIKAFSLGVDWEAFEDIIEKGNDPAKEEILEIIHTDNPIVDVDGKTVDIRPSLLSELENGRVWARLNEEIFEDLRQAGGKISCIVSSKDEQGMSFEHRKDTLIVIHKDTVYNYVYDYAKGKAPKGYAPKGFRKDSLFRTPVIAFRSNILVPLMNIGVEVPVSNRVSLEADFYSPWAMREWVDKKMPAHQYCFQFVGGTVGCRFWTGEFHNAKTGDPRYRLRGHSIGIVASGGVYDLGWDWKGQQGEFAFLGADYLYGLPLGKGGAHFEFNIGVGYGINRYNNYVVRHEGGKLVNDGGKQVRYRPVPIRVGISVAIPVFKENKNTGIKEGLGND